MNAFEEDLELTILTITRDIKLICHLYFFQCEEFRSMMPAQQSRN